MNCIHAIVLKTLVVLETLQPVQVLIVDEHQTPIPNVQVSVYQNNVLKSKKQSDALGYVFFEPMKCGEYTLRVQTLRGFERKQDMHVCVKTSCLFHVVMHKQRGHAFQVKMPLLIVFILSILLYLKNIKMILDYIDESTKNCL